VKADISKGHLEGKSQPMRESTMKRISTLAALAVVALLVLSPAAEAQFFGPMGGNGMMGPGYGYGATSPVTGLASPVWRYRFGTPGPDTCRAMMGPATGFGYSMLGPWTGNGYADPDAAVVACLSSLRAQLGISAEQQAAWQQFADAVTQQSQQMTLFHRQVALAAATAPERVAQYAQFMLDRAEDAAAVSQAVAELYAALSSTQQALFDAYFAW
jgi:periplasmic protein CpxP/Spy